MAEDHPHSIAVFCQPPNDKDATASRRRAVHGDACQDEQGARRTIPSTYLTLTTPSCSRERGRRRFALVHENPSTCRVARPLATASRLGFASGNPTPSARAHHATEMKCLRFGYGVVSRGRSRRWHCHTQSCDRFKMSSPRALAERVDKFCAFGLIARRHFESVAVRV